MRISDWSSDVCSSDLTYDPDRLAYDQQKLRLFYLQNGYADFRVISAVAELTSNKQDFIITYVVEEGERYKFGKVDVESSLRDFKPEMLQTMLPMKTGDRSEEHTSELQSLMRTSYAVFCLKKKNK